MPAVRFSDSGKCRVGEPAIAVGNPFGLGKSVSAGVISAKNRDIVWTERKSVYENLIQTDISLNVGNSGGPLINIDGDLIGMNLAVPVGSQGISFAIPSNVVKRVYEDFFKKKSAAKT
jgi:S1-C subfamily serine protease